MKLKLRPYVELIRPINDVMVGLGVVAGYLVGGGRYPLGAALGFSTGFLIAGYSMVVNDVEDVNVDTLNRLARPIVRGDVSRRRALELAAVMAAVGALAAAATGPLTLAIAALFAALSLLYNMRLKRAGFAGNVVVALSIAIPFLYGGMMAGSNGLLVAVMSGTSFLTGLSREVLKTIADVAGDSAAGVRSLAVEMGIRPAAIVSAVLTLGAIPIAYLPVALGRCSAFYVVGVTIASALFIAISAMELRLREPQQAYSLKRRMLIPMAIGLITYIVQGII